MLGFSEFFFQGLAKKSFMDGKRQYSESGGEESGFLIFF